MQTYTLVIPIMLLSYYIIIYLVILMCSLCLLVDYRIIIFHPFTLHYIAPDIIDVIFVYIIITIFIFLYR